MIEIIVILENEMIDIGRCYGNCRAHEKQTFRGFTVSTRFLPQIWGSKHHFIQVLSCRNVGKLRKDP